MAQKLKIAIPAEEKDVPNYLAALKALGAQPVLVDSDARAQDYDGLLLPGGGDVDPARYHEAIEPECESPDVALDEWQMTVLDRFVKAQKPVMGICRGIQVLNVYFGGTLIQHVPSYMRHRRTPGIPEDKVHMNHAEKGSVLEMLYGMQDFATNSSHHQAVQECGKGLIAIQHSDDGLVEAVVHETLPVFGVQWHPERMAFAHKREDTVDGSIVISYFLSLCEKKS